MAQEIISDFQSQRSSNQRSLDVSKLYWKRCEYLNKMLKLNTIVFGWVQYPKIFQSVFWNCGFPDLWFYCEAKWREKGRYLAIQTRSPYTAKDFLINFSILNSGILPGKYWEHLPFSPGRCHTRNFSIIIGNLIKILKVC